MHGSSNDAVRQTVTALRALHAGLTDVDVTASPQQQVKHKTVSLIESMFMPSTNEDDEKEEDGTNAVSTSDTLMQRLTALLQSADIIASLNAPKELLDDLDLRIARRNELRDE